MFKVEVFMNETDSVVYSQVEYTDVREIKLFISRKDIDDEDELWIKDIHKIVITKE